jgi:hypothetical protein
VVGIKVVAEMHARARLGWLLGLIAVAGLALLGFAVVPARRSDEVRGG